MNDLPLLRCGLSLLALGAAVEAVGAQDDLAARIVAVVERDDWNFELTRSGLRDRATGEVVDALVVLRDALPSHHWARALGLVRSDRADLDALWLAEPQRRRARAPVFADAMSGWAQRHAAAAPDERADIEYLARFLPPQLHHGDAARGPDATDRAESAELLQRIAATAERQRAEAVADLLRALDDPGDPGVGVLLGHAPRSGPFALCTALADAEPRVRLCAAVALRLRLGLELPVALARAVAADPLLSTLLHGRFRVPRPPFDAGAFDRSIEDLAAGRWPPSGWPSPAGLDDATERRLAKALIAFALRAPAEAAGTTSPIPARAAQEARVIAALGTAAGLGAQHFGAVVALAAATTDDELARRALHGAIQSGAPSVAAAQAAAPLLAALLDHPAAMVAEAAAVLAAAVAPRVPGSRLAALVGDRALAIVARDPTALRAAPFVASCPVGEHLRPGRPLGRDAWLVYGACAIGDRRMTAPLFAALGRLAIGAGGPAIPPVAPSNEEFLLLCAARLAPHLDVDDARRLHALVAPGAPRQPTGPQSRAEARCLEVCAALLARVPDDLVGWYAAQDLRSRVHLAHLVAPWLDAVDPARADALIGASDADLETALLQVPALFLRSPARLVAAFDAGGRAREQAVAAVRGLWSEHAERLLELVVQDALPRPLVAASVGAGPLRLEDLAAILPVDGADAARWGPALAHAVDTAPESTPDRDLAALRTLAAAPTTDVVLATVRRAADRGAAGGQLATATVDRLLRGAPDVEATARVLEVAVAAGVAVSDLPAVLARLRASPYGLPQMVADAAALRFLGMDPRACMSPYPGRAIGLAAIDVDVAVLREALEAQHGDELVWLIQRSTPATCRAALQLAGERASWDGGLERAVTWKTSDDDPAVRLAAYRALASRDPELWPCAWLRHEGVFDPDPEVQRFARGED